MEQFLSPAVQEFADARELLRGGLEKILDLDLTRMDDDAVLVGMVALERVNRKVFAARVHFTAEIDDRNLAKPRGSRTTGTFLRQLVTIGSGEASGLVRVAGAMKAAHPR